MIILMANIRTLRAYISILKKLMMRNGFKLNFSIIQLMKYGKKQMYARIYNILKFYLNKIQSKMIGFSNIFKEAYFRDTTIK